jgi:hypothetical protein
MMDRTRDERLERFLDAAMRSKRVRGFVKVRAWKRGRLLWEIERENTVVTAGLTPIANLIGGGSLAANSISIIGFGSGAPTNPPPVTDTDFTALPGYYKAMASITFPAAGQATFNWSLVGATDTAAVGMVITELGFFANTGSISLPVFRSSGAAPNVTMCAHVVEPAFTVLSGGTYTGNWTFVA